MELLTIKRHGTTVRVTCEPQWAPPTTTLAFSTTQLQQTAKLAHLSQLQSALPVQHSTTSQQYILEAVLPKSLSSGVSVSKHLSKSYTELGSLHLIANPQLFAYCVGQQHKQLIHSKKQSVYAAQHALRICHPLGGTAPTCLLHLKPDTKLQGPPHQTTHQCGNSIAKPFSIGLLKAGSSLTQHIIVHYVNKHPRPTMREYIFATIHTWASTINVRLSKPHVETLVPIQAHQIAKSCAHKH